LSFDDETFSRLDHRLRLRRLFEDAALEIQTLHLFRQKGLLAKSSAIFVMTLTSRRAAAPKPQKISPGLASESE
jgi:hypothetical protein